MSAAAAKQQTQIGGTLAVGDLVCHRQHGEGVIVGMHGAYRFAVDFLDVGRKHMPPHTLRYNPRADEPGYRKSFLQRHAEWKAACKASTDRWLAECAARAAGRATLTPDVPHVAAPAVSEHASPDIPSGGATIIQFPRHRIVRHISHGRGVVVAGAA